MNINLVDVDGHNFPNLALMKLSAWHKQNGDTVELNGHGKYDIIYKSKVFTFTRDREELWFAPKIKQGGTGYKSCEVLPDEIEHICPDYSLYNCDVAYGFLTRGCIRNCEWCIVPSKEGKLRPNADITEFIADKRAAVLMDNNVLASDWGLKQIEKIIDMKIKVDFNQGLDARIIANNPNIAELLSRVKWYKPLRMACDTREQMEYVGRATELLRKYGTTPKNYFVYMLVRDIENAHDRALYLKGLGLEPFAQPYRDFENNKIDKSAKKFARWVNHKAIFKTIAWENYH